MIDINNPEVRKIQEGINKAMLRKVKKGGYINEEIVMENKLLTILCNNFDLEPREYAVLMNEKYGYHMSGNDVIRILRNRRINYPNDRKELLQWAEEVAGYFEGAVNGDRESYDKYETAINKKKGKKNYSQERLALIMLYERYPEIDISGNIDALYSLGHTLARYLFYEISDVISEVYGFPQYRDTNKKTDTKNDNRKISYNQAIRRINQLENILERTNTMLQDLQEEFEEQLEANKVKELADFFAKLNSEKYGCILDELLIVNKGIDGLKKNGVEIPIEINGLLIMVKKLIQFVRDSHIEPVMKVGAIREVIAADVEFCDYEGTPFSTPEEKKNVKVVSPGWIYKDKELQISRPKVKEEK